MEKMNNKVEAMDSLGDLLEDMKMKQDDGLDGLIARNMRRLLWNMVLKTLCVVVVLAGLLVFLLNPLMNALNPDPLRMNEKQYGKDGEIVSESLLYQMLNGWIEAQYPYSMLDYVNVEKQGFGRYEIEAHVHDLKQMLVAGGDMNYRCQVSSGNLKIVMNTADNLRAYSFSREEGDDSVLHDIEDIAKLPESAWVYVAVSAKDPQEIMVLQEHENEELSIDWAEVYDSIGEAGFGINLRRKEQGLETEAANLKKQYLEELELIASTDNLWTNSLGIGKPSGKGYVYFSPMGAREDLQKTIQAIEAMESLKTQYYFISGARDAVLDYIQGQELRSAKIIHVALWRMG